MQGAVRGSACVPVRKGGGKASGRLFGRPETTIFQEVTCLEPLAAWLSSCGGHASGEPSCAHPSCVRPSYVCPFSDGPSCVCPSCDGPASSLLASYLTTFLNVVRRTPWFARPARTRAPHRVSRRASPATQRAAYADRKPRTECDASSQLRSIGAGEKSRQQKIALFTTFSAPRPDAVASPDHGCDPRAPLRRIRITRAASTDAGTRRILHRVSSADTNARAVAATPARCRSGRVGRDAVGCRTRWRPHQKTRNPMACN